jgi:D-glycero-alpha-D-manno-heptose 1-phosphate guanylyltransferase
MTASRNGVVPLILAGGRGIRIAHLFPDLPKPGIPVAGKPFLAWILVQLSEFGFAQVVVSGGYRFQDLRKKVSPYIPQGMEVVWVEEKQLLGTGGGAVYAAEESRLQPDFWLILNGDSYLKGEWLEQILATNQGEACLVAREVDDISRYGSLEVNQGWLKAFHEKQGKGRGLINAGIYFFPRIWLNQNVKCTPQSLETDFFPRWIQEGQKIRVVLSDAPFLDIGTPADFCKADIFFSNFKASS